MPELTQQQISDLISATQKSAGAMGKAAEALTRGVAVKSNRNRSREDPDVSRLSNELRNRLDRATGHANRLTVMTSQLAGSAESFGNAIDTFLNGLVGGIILTKTIQGVTRMTETYQRLTDIGQTFGGSMIEMAKQAGQAGLTMNDFASLLEKASGAAAVLARPGGQGGLGALALEVRKNIREFGNFGMTLEQVGELTADYAETMRLQGLLGVVSNESVAHSASQMAGELSAFATLTGKSRKDMQKATNEALRDVAVTSRIAGGMASDQRRSMERTTAFLSSLQGKAGEFMTSNFTQALGYGSALFTDGVRTFVDAGFGQGVSMIDRLVQQTESGRQDMGHLFEFVDDFVAETDRMNDSLRLQALAGNENARQILRMRDEMRMMANMSHAERQRRMDDARRQEGLTRFATTFNDILNTLTGAFRAGLGEGLQGLADNLKVMMESSTIDRLRDMLSRLGGSVARLLTSALTPQNIERFVYGVGAMVEGALNFARMLFETNALGLAFKFIGDVLSGVMWGFGKLRDGLAWFSRWTGIGGEHLATVLGGLIGLGVAVGALSLAVLAVAAPILLLKAAAVGAWGALGVLASGLLLLRPAFEFFRRFMPGSRAGNTPSINPNAGGAAANNSRWSFLPWNRPNPPAGGAPPAGGPPGGGGPEGGQGGGGAQRPGVSSVPSVPATPGAPAPAPATPAPNQLSGASPSAAAPAVAQAAPSGTPGPGATAQASNATPAAQAARGGGVLGALGSALSVGASAFAGSTPAGIVGSMLLNPSSASAATMPAAGSDAMIQIMREQQRMMEQQVGDLERRLAEERNQRANAPSDTEQTRVLRRIEQLMQEQTSLQTALGIVQENIARQQMRATERAGSPQ